MGHWIWFGGSRAASVPRVGAKLLLNRTWVLRDFGDTNS